MSQGEKAIPASELHRFLEYDSETGKFYWKHREGSGRGVKIFNVRFAGKEAFVERRANGFVGGRIFGHFFYAHRIAWAMSHGEWPKGVVTQKDGDRANNRLRNLVEKTKSKNIMDSALYSNNKSGHKGVFACTKTGKWRAQIRVKGRWVSLGVHHNLDAAIKARKLAEKQYYGTKGGA